MGQYYIAVLEDNRGEIKSYIPKVLVNGEEDFQGYKLMEHSWWGNAFVCAIAEMIYKNGHRVVWLGDYADTFMANDHPDGFAALSPQKVETLNKLWQIPEKPDEVLKHTDFSLDGKYLVNYNYDLYLDLDEYYEKNVMHADNGDWCVNPLPLLTCVGNGCGGGDYNAPTEASNYDSVGSWAGCLLSIEDKPPQGYKPASFLFKEKGWEPEEKTEADVALEKEWDAALF